MDLWTVYKDAEREWANMPPRPRPSRISRLMYEYLLAPIAEADAVRWLMRHLAGGATDWLLLEALAEEVPLVRRFMAELLRSDEIDRDFYTDGEGDA